MVATLSIKGVSKKNARPDITSKIYYEVEKLEQKNNKINIIWIPAHIGIEGNEIADKVANTGRSNNLNFRNIRLGVCEIKSLMKMKLRKQKMQEEWEKSNSETVKEFRKFHPLISKKININFKDRKINILRLNIPKFTFIHRSEIYCIKCKQQVTTDHVLIDCKFFDVERNKIIDNFQKHKISFNKTNLLSTNRDGSQEKLIFNLIDSINKKINI